MGFLKNIVDLWGPKFKINYFIFPFETIFFKLIYDFISSYPLMELGQVENYGATSCGNIYIMVRAFAIVTGAISLQVLYVNPPTTGSPIS